MLGITTSKLGWDSAAEKEFWAHKCRDSFWWFAKEAYNIDGHPKGGWLSESVHRPLCDWFEGHVKEWLRRRASGARGQTNLAILVPREFGKTTLITHAGLIWIGLQDLELSIYLGSETAEKAVKFFQPIPGALEGADEFQRFTTYYGNWKDKKRKWGSDAIVHGLRRGTSNQDPSFGTWGVATGLTGAHPDVLCLDDPTSYDKLSKDSNWLYTVNEHVTSLIPVLKGNGLRIFVGTRYGDGDHFGTQFRKHGCRSVMGMSCPDVTPRETGIWDLYFLAARDLQGTPTYPEVWDESRLQVSEAESSTKHWAQMMNEPSRGEHVPLTRKDIDKYWVAKKDIPKNLRISMHIDTAFRYNERQTKGDETVIEVWGHDRTQGDVYYLEGYGSPKWMADQFNAKLVIMLQNLRAQGKWPFILTDEMEIGGKAGMWESAIQTACHAGGIPAPRIMLLNRRSQNKNKLARIVDASNYWKQGKVKLVEGAPGVDRLIDQMLKIGYTEHDDWSDAASDVFHKEVYNPVRLPHNIEDNQLVRPFDQELQDGRLSIGDIIKQARREQSAMREEYLGIS